MTRTRPFLGNLFTEDFLYESIEGLLDWQNMTEEEIDGLTSAIRSLYDRFPKSGSPNESQTENDLIWPVLAQLGWTASLRQQNLSPHGRQDVPDGLLFADDSSKERANSYSEEWRRYGHGLAVVESKRWTRPLDRGSGSVGEASAPSTQILRYLRRIDDLTVGNLRYGILTNGVKWRLYYAGARSVAEEFFELDLVSLLDLPLFRYHRVVTDPDERRYWLKVFALVFRRDSFLPDAADGLTFHQRAIAEGQYYQERVANNLSDLVFGRVFPDVACALAAEKPDAPLSEVRDAALVVLYRLLFILYAEDRDLLPVRDTRYGDYAFREKVRLEIGRRKDRGDVFSTTAARYWLVFDDLCRAIDQGDTSIGLPPYDGGLFDRTGTPLLLDVRLSDSVMADTIEALSFEITPEGHRYINYRDLGVQQLGSIYERILEQEIVRESGKIVIRPNLFARKDSGSFYTPPELVALIIGETLEPLVRSLMDTFASEASQDVSGEHEAYFRQARLNGLDPAERLLDLKICDPSMGSGHFLVSLVDYLADQIIAAMAEVEAMVDGYISPIIESIQRIRTRIIRNAEERKWAFDWSQLDDRHIIRRMVLKRCVYGVDRNPMAVELAKVSLWLHTFTVGAPLSFLDHHLRCGDSLFGGWVGSAIDRVEQKGGLFLQKPLEQAIRSAASMQLIEGLTDAEISEAHRSADIFAEVLDMTASLNAFLSLLHAFEWLDLRDRDDRSARAEWLDGTFGDPIGIALGGEPSSPKSSYLARFSRLLETARDLVATERFLNWQVTFPGVWSNWEDEELSGGFDAVIGNPPWDRMKLQQVEWFSVRRQEIAKLPRASERKQKIAELEAAGDPLARDFELARERAAAALRVSRGSGDYPLLSAGDLNLYSLFVERAMTLAKPDGIVGLLVPSGIASDRTAARFFKGIATEGRLKALLDFENGRPSTDDPAFFPDVHKSFKFCVFVASPSPLPNPARCAFFLHDLNEIGDPERCFSFAAESFARVNPNTGTAPIFRTRRDADLTTAIYGRLPVLVNRSSGKPVKTWPVNYTRMFDMTNDSELFRTRKELAEREGAWPIGDNRFENPSGEWVPLYQGMMVQAFDHRAASISLNPDNLHRPAQPLPTTIEQHQNPDWLPEPQFWVLTGETDQPSAPFLLGFKHVTAATNVRTMIAALIPGGGAGNSLPLLIGNDDLHLSADLAAVFLANLNALPLDYVLRQKLQGQNLNLYILEQLPVVPRQRYDTVRFGPKTAAEIVKESVLELTYTSGDMSPFAHELGHLDEAGQLLPPFGWDGDRRLRLRARLDALYFHLYGITARDDVRHIYSTFPIMEREETKAHGHYRSCELCLAYMNALAADQPDAEIEL